MRDLYSDDYESVAGDGADRLIPDGVRRLTGAAVFLGLVAAHGPLVLPARHPRRRRGADHQGDGGPGPDRAGGPRRPAGGAPGARGQHRAGRPAGAAAARAAAGARRSRRCCRPRTRRRASWSSRAPAILAEQVLGEDDDLPMPPQDGRRTTSAPRRRADPRRPTPAPRPRRRPAAPARGRATGRRNLVVARAEAGRCRGAEARRGDSPSRPQRRRSPAPRRPPRPRRRRARSRACGRARGWCSSAPSTARRSPARPGRSWSRRTATCSASKSLYVERTTANARVFYRLRVAGFADAEETRQMCEALRARGVACIPVTLQ